nr:programmed cell death protein 1-like isoform X1 [Labrus bergylta]
MMKFFLSGLLLASFCALSSWSVSSGTPVVTQSPDVSVMEGETLNITCCWTGELERGRVNWLKDKTCLNNELFFNNDHFQGSGKQNRSVCFHLTFLNITRNDSGSYTCNLTVEIPVVFRAEGKSTVITVTDREDTFEDATKEDEPEGLTSGDPIPVIISLAVIAPLLLVTLICFCALRRKQARAARVIYEVPHIDSDVAEMDKTSTSSSRGSSQWCQVPVYESFDYFQRVQDKESD